MLRRKVWVRGVLLIGLLVLACEQLWRHCHDMVFTEQFVVVEPGKIYRGAWQQPWPMRRIVRNYKIKTVLALAHPDDHPLAIREKAMAQELGFNWVHIPIVDDRRLADGQSLSDQLEEAAAVVADPKNQPVYFHCHHGINRATMVQIAYRTLFCGWTLDQATEEVSRNFHLVTNSPGPDYRYMKTFYEQRVLPRRQAQAAAAAQGTQRQ